MFKGMDGWLDLHAATLLCARVDVVGNNGLSVGTNHRTKDGRKEKRKELTN